MTLATAPELRPTLSTALREGSRAEHEQAENSPFMSELLEGGLAPEAYADLLMRLRIVYEALEATVRTLAEDALVSALYDPALERLAAIDADLTWWAPDRSLEPVDSPAAYAYADRLRSAASWGGLVLAHHYTRYLGDLSGGQVIGRMLQRTYDLPAGRGVAFYSFPAIAKPKPYKDRYRARLDALPLSPSDVARAVEETRVAFALNRALFAELGQNLDAYRR
ncbi:biliverdin-producing heme oxygenase [Nocardioides acrostichi]|uniref:Biliverdin-producing heme oxygenase n=1 Tax=Nocardioides acrostichi TaxID=2784339 RepID=A0A930V0N8_9ACTN|nr:biliverdin-producing heme oxygenase [Nocardioides acrostichi]MBF4161089.1 biliverdin-producing heme oxygenase [Nocardioides acrostichi]